ncbi:MAG: aminodeoxychorismate synthase component I, partial [Shewanella sp.]
MANRAALPLAVRQLDWTFSTAAIFAHFAAEPWAILLDSANAPHQDAKFDMICAGPIATLITQGELTDIQVHLHELAKPPHLSPQDDPFSLVNQLLRHWYPHSFACDLPFSGGAMGSFSYDLGRRIEQLPCTAAKDIHLGEMNIGFYDWALIFDYQQQSWFMVHYLGDAALDAQLKIIEAKIAHTTEQAVFCLTSSWSAQLTKAQYTSRFNQVQAYLHSGDCYQINLTQRFEAEYQGDE